MTSRSATNKLNWSVYVLLCKDRSFYTGITNNIQERLTEHNRGLGARYTLIRKPVELIYSENDYDKSGARKREIQIKGWTRIKKEKLINGLLKKPDDPS